MAKKFLLSQIEYFNSLIQFNENIISFLRLELGNYIKFKLKISIDKVFQKISLEGLSMINIKTTLKASELGYTKKTFYSNDFWAYEIKQHIINTDFEFHFKII